MLKLSTVYSTLYCMGYFVVVFGVGWVLYFKLVILVV